jgi:uncharacterized membrane protein
MNSDRRDFALLVWSVIQIEAIIIALAGIAGWFAGPIAALVVGAGFTILIFAAVSLIVAIAAAVTWISDRFDEARKPESSSADRVGPPRQRT